MKFLILSAVLFISGTLFSQARNQKMRELNHIVELMNAFSMRNQTWYYDAIQLQNALHASSKKLNENYFYCDKTQHKGLMSYTELEEKFHFKELTPNAQNQIPAYQSDYIAWLEAKETVIHAKAKNPKLFAPISSPLMNYLAATDSLFKVHEWLNRYVSEKLFRSDDEFRQARNILFAHDQWFEQCYLTFRELDNALVDYTNQNFPPLKTHWELQQGLQEFNLTMNLLTIWEKELYSENRSNDAKYDILLRSLNESGLKKDSLYLYKTRGYGHLSSGFWLHTNYRTFYTSMHSTIYWFASHKIVTEPYLKPSQKAYNEFVHSYNSIVEDYNDYIEIADGLTFTKTSECCLSRSEIDTNQNVLLMAPRLPHKFEYQEKKPEEVVQLDPVPESSDPDVLLIQKALPHHLIYLLDASSSMNESGKLAHLKEHATNLVQIQREVDRISIVTFSGKANILLQSVPCSQKKHITEKIERIHAFGQTNIQSGFETVKNLLSSDKLENGVNSVILITDGEFPLSDETKSLITRLKTDGMNVYFVYLGTPVGKRSRRQFESMYSDLGVILYDTNRIDLKDALLKIATE